MSRTNRILKKTLVSVAACVSLITGSVLLAAPANAATVIGVCTIIVQVPHDSGHVHGTVNVVGTTSCNVVMSEIYLRITLQKADGRTWVSKKFVDYFNTPQEQDNSAVSCDSGGAGTYRGYMSYVLRAPAGYNPSYASGTVYGPWNSVPCSGANRVAAGANTQSDSASTDYQITVPIYATN